MPFSFPASPSVSQQSQQNGRTYSWSGSAWELVASGGGGGSDSRWDLFLPPAPTSVTPTGGNAQVTLSWTAPTVLTQTPILDYVVQFSSNSGSTWTTFSDGTSTATSATVTGLTNGTAYTFRVAAVNGVGTGAYSTASSAATPGDVFREIPTMTSNTAPSGVASAVGSAGGDNYPYYAFDANPNTEWWGNRNPFNDPLRSLSYAFPSGTKSRIGGFSFTPQIAGSNSDAPNQWRFYGSNDGTTWTLLDERSNQAGLSNWPSGTTTKNYMLSAPANYQMYRWDFSTDDTQSSGPALIAAQLLA